MLWILLAILGLWVAAGLVLLFLKSRKEGNTFQRWASGRVFALGDKVEVTLRVMPAAKMNLAADHDVILAIDCSGSMGSAAGSPLCDAKRSAENFIQQLPDQIYAGVVAFDHEAQLLCPITRESRRALRVLGPIGSGGGTAIHLALNCCQEALNQGRPEVKKTVILLSDGQSDHHQAVAAAEQLRRSPANPQIICVGYGSGVDHFLMEAVAGPYGKYCHVRGNNTEDLQNLFELLARYITDQMAIAGVVEEVARAPKPFRLARTGGLHAIGEQANKEEGVTWITWAVPLMDPRPVLLDYELKPECPGWHLLALPGPDSHATWRLRDGNTEIVEAPKGPWVLVLPRWLRWSWPVLNPLFWLAVKWIFGGSWERFWCRYSPDSVGADAPIEPLTAHSFPDPLPDPMEKPYQAMLQPALVIGLGEVGELALCGLKERLQDRGLEDGPVKVLALGVAHHANRRFSQRSRPGLSEHERVEIPQDLRPYLEGLRAQEPSSRRAWIPWREWLTAASPLTTVRGVDDRRKARLALLLRPQPLEEILIPLVRQIYQQEGKVMVVASPTEAEGSGLLAEVAHICATQGIGVNAVLAPGLVHQTADGAVVALARELERWVLMGGEQVFSDRHEPLVPALHIFDRIMVLGPAQTSDKDAAAVVANLLWAMLAYPEVLQHLPMVHEVAGQAHCASVSLAGYNFPFLNLWRWVRENTLTMAINGQWLNLKSQGHQFRLTLPPDDDVENDRAEFWQPAYISRPQPLFLAKSGQILRLANPVTALISLQEEVDKSYHQQVIYCDKERRRFTTYVGAWCYHILAREQDQGGWGMPHLLMAVQSVQKDFCQLMEHLEKMSRNVDFANLTNFASSLLVDFQAILAGWQRELSQWVAKFAGPQPECQVTEVPSGHVPVCYDLEKARKHAEEGLDLPVHTDKPALKIKFQQWYDPHGADFLNQLRFKVHEDPGSGRLSLGLYCFKQDLGLEADIGQTFREALDRYRNEVLIWPVETWLPPVAMRPQHNPSRVGQHSQMVFPDLEAALTEEDPFVAMALGIDKTPLSLALEVVPPPAGEPPYTWPEEANAARIAAKILNRETQWVGPFSPRVVQLMRDTFRLHCFFADLAQGRVTFNGTNYVLAREGATYLIGPTEHTLAGIDAFENVVRQAVSLEVDLGNQPIPPPTHDWLIGPRDAVTAVEQNRLANQAIDSPRWRMWQDVIQGLALEHGLRHS